MMFSFGDLVEIPDRRGGVRVVGTYSLHVQCPWRLLHANQKILVGSGDILETFKGDGSPQATFLSRNLCDQRL